MNLIASKRGKITHKKLFPLLLILPAFGLHLAIITLPSLSTIYLSLYEWNGIGGGKFIGLDNFIEIFTKDDVIWAAFMNNIKWTAIFLTLPITLGLLVALVVSRLKKGQMVYRTIFFLPYVLSAAIAGRIWTSFYNPYFGFGAVFEKLGLTSLAGIKWLGDPDIALYSVAFVDNWHWWGFVMVLFIAALHQVNPSLYEAARVEGANWLQEFVHITIPGVRPTLVFIFMMTIIWSFLTFDYVWVMTMGGPGQATEIISTWMYKNAFINYRAGYANAICVLQSLICLVVFAATEYIRKKGWDV
jgi:raffinose/stachyose/melibiose transport system permease protein